MIEPRLLERVIKKKKELDDLRPFDHGALAKLQEAFNIELTYNSNAIEGNSLSLSETKLVLEEGITIGGKSMREHLEATNHQKAIEFLQSLVRKKRLEEKDILQLHAVILDRIDPHNAGFYRRHGVRISGTDYTPPNFLKVPELMKQVYARINEKTKEPIGQAALIHLQFVDIHPFVDGNGRTARLLTNLYLMRNGYPPVIYLRAERKKYIRSIIRAQIGHDPTEFINFTAKAVERSLCTYLDSLGTKTSEYLSLAQAAKFSRYSADYLSFLARTGKIGAVKFGRNWKITLEALQEYEKEKTTSSQAFP